MPPRLISTLPAIASTYSVENEAVYDGVSRPGVRIVSFAPMLKHGMFPLAPILERSSGPAKMLWAPRSKSNLLCACRGIRAKPRSSAS